MSMEDRMRAFIQGAGEGPSPSEAQWNDFLRRAHRDRFVRRAVTIAVAAAVVVFGSVGGRALVRELGEPRPQPPVEQPKPPSEPERMGRVSQECPRAPEHEPAGTLGEVAYASGNDLHLLDLTTNEDRVLVLGGKDFFPSPVRVSPDGSWIAFGAGYVVPTAGGEVCAPLGERFVSSHVEWTAENELVAVAEGALMVGGPGDEPRAIEVPDDSLAVGDYVLDDTRRFVAFDAHDSTGKHAESIWVAGLREETYPSTIYELPKGDSSTLEVAAAGGTVGDPGVVGPLDSAVLAFRTPVGSASLGADAVELIATGVADPGSATPVTEMLPRPDFLAPCTDRIIVAAGVDRSVTRDKQLVSLSARTTLRPEPVTDDASRSFFWPDCSPDGRIAATYTPNEEETPMGTLERAIAIFTPTGNEIRLQNDRRGYGYEFARFSRAGDLDTLLVVERELTSEGTARLVLLDVTGERTETPASLGRVSGNYGQYEYSRLFDWYQP